MAPKVFIISSSGLKNVVLNKYQEEDNFVFVFGEVEFQMKSFFAEFISPVVSHLHQTDPTINTINFNEIKGMNQDSFNNFSKSLITQDTISLIEQISSGSSIEINEEQAIRMRIISILLGNEELHRKLNELFPENYSEENINSYMKNIDCLYNFSRIYPTFSISGAISFIANHFYMIDKKEFLKQSREIQYMIISNEELQIESEDSLFDIISQIVETKKEEEEEFEDILFFEQIEFRCLSESKLNEFISVFDFNDMSGQLWQNLCQCFFSQHHANKCQQKVKRYLNKKVNDLQKIIVAGYDGHNLLGEKPNNENEEGAPIIHPPVNLPIDPSSLLSYSTFGAHSVLVTNDGSLKCIGYNMNGIICNSIKKNSIDKFTEFSINDSSGNKLVPLSAVCCEYGTLYMFSKSMGIGRHLVLCDCEINEGKPVFLNIGNHHPIALFGGISNSAAINSEGEVIFINRESVINSPDSLIKAVSLPDGEKASSVACCYDSIVVLSSNGRVYESPINSSSNLKFSPVSDLADHEIICLSGTSDHCLAVTKEGHVFVRGSNEFGQLGLGEGIESVSSFTEISSLEGLGIKAAYAGYIHSLFQTSEGKILSCGDNYSGELLLNSDLGERSYSPTETIITSGASFCIAGGSLSVVFIGSNPPPNSPNMRILDYKQ